MRSGSRSGTTGPNLGTVCLPSSRRWLDVVTAEWHGLNRASGKSSEWPKTMSSNQGPGVFMIFPARTWIRSLVVILLAACAWGQVRARLETADTELVLEAGVASPKLLSLEVPGRPKWTNGSSEGLIPFVEISASQAPITWQLDLNASEIGPKRVAFVYASANPQLRLTWEWRVPQDYGPIEHQIRIENLAPQDVWIPIEDSLAFRWQVSRAEPLKHVFAEKGADTPSPVGTHEASLGEA